MNKQRNQTRLTSFTALSAMLALCGLSAGCGPGEITGVASLYSALTVNHTALIGSSSGTQEGPGTVDHQSAVTRIDAYANGSYVFGIKLWWGTASKMYGQDNNISVQTLDCSLDPVSEIKYYVDVANIARGMRFKTVHNSVGPLAVGFLDGTDKQTAFSDPNAVFTDLVTAKGTVSGTTTIWGEEFYYTTP